VILRLYQVSSRQEKEQLFLMIRVPKIIVAGEGGRGGESIFRSLCCTGPKSFKPYQMILLLFDLVFNWIVDWAHTDPLVMLIIFV